MEAGYGRFRPAMTVSRRLGRRLVAGAALPLVVALIVQAAYTVVSQRMLMDDGLRNKARSLAALTVNVVGPSIVFDDAKAVAEGLGYIGDPELAFAAVIDPAGEIGGFRGEPAMRDAVADLHSLAQPTTVSRGDLLIATAPVIAEGHRVATVVVGLNHGAAWAELTHMSETAAAISLIGIAIAVVVVQLLARRIVKVNGQMRLVLDSVDEALATVNRDGSLSSECSLAFTDWFGAPDHRPFWQHIASGDEAAMLELSWDQLVAGFLPPELLVAQFPSALVREGRHYRLQIKPTLDGERLTSALLRISDVTSEVEAQRAIAAQREYAALIERLLSDPDGLREFVREADELVARIRDGGADLADLRRTIHTLKGNAGLFGFAGIADLAHRLEDGLEETFALEPALVDELVERWSALSERASRFGVARGDVAVSRRELDQLADQVLVDPPAAARRLRWLGMESVDGRLASLAPHLERTAAQLGKPSPEVAIDASDVRVPANRMRPFWTALAHVVRNAIDHGIESPDERTAAGKPSRGRIELRARASADVLSIELADDGRGIDWMRVGERARAAGLPAETPGDLERALFADGLSTAARVTDVSGRGVGLAAVRAAVEQLGGDIHLTSSVGQGTRWMFAFRMETR